MTIMIIIVFTVIALWRVPRLIKAKRWGYLAAFCSVLAAVCVLSLVLASQIKISSPRKAVEDVLDALDYHGQ